MPEVDFKTKFCEKYFDKNTWDLDVLNQVDVLLKDKNGDALLYIESKFKIENENAHRTALAQVILTNKKQKKILSRVALIYQDIENNDILELLDCSDDSVMFNNDFNWQAEKASMPTADAINRINDRLHNKITRYKNNEIKEFYKNLKTGNGTQIQITAQNFNVVYNEWKNEIQFIESVKDEQEIINLFLIDILHGAVYTEESIESVLGVEQKRTEPLIREGTNLSFYKLQKISDGNLIIMYSGRNRTFYTFSNIEKYNFFWKKYKRPPVKEQFKIVLERSATLYTDKYRRDTGGEYTPTCFVEKQNEILRKHYDLNEFIVFDPCAGVGNLENQFGRDFKEFCYLSTLEQMDVDTCLIKGFENAVRFDYLENDKEPLFEYKGKGKLNIRQICDIENKKLMIVMNPPYQNKKEMKNNTAIEFFNKVLKLKPDVIVFYYMTESFLRDEIENYIDSGYKIVSHIFSNAKKTFQLSQWSISQIIFDKENGKKIDRKKIPAERYELDLKTNEFKFIKTYTYDNFRPSLLKEIDSKIKENLDGMILGNFSKIVAFTMNLTNKVEGKGNAKITTHNLKYCLLSRGINFNDHNKYFERNQHVYRGKMDQISKELLGDAVAFALFFTNCAFTNKGQKNYIMPFNAQQLGCAKNDLNVLFPPDDDIWKDEKPFDFREFLKQFEFSKEAIALFLAALEIFRFYHQNKEYKNKDWNDSFYDITNTIMGRNLQKAEKRTNLTVKTKSTKGTRGFGRNTIKYVVGSEYLPIFENFFNARDILAKKINRQLVESGLLLWERENIY